MLLFIFFVFLCKRGEMVSAELLSEVRELLSIDVFKNENRLKEICIELRKDSQYGWLVRMISSRLGEREELKSPTLFMPAVGIV